MEKKKTYLYIYVCMAALLFVGAAISLSVGSAEIGIIGSIKLALSGIPGIGQFVDISAYSTMQRYIILQVRLPRVLLAALVGAGLSSSAAFEVVVGTIISGLYNDMKINSVEIAQISQYAENVFFKKPCGLMDQMACSVGGMVNIDFKDPTKPIVKKVPTEFEKYDYSLCIVDTKGDHVDLTDDYAMIPSEMKKVANFLGEDYLRDCDSNEFYIRLDEIREAVGDRPVLRAIHFFNEEHNVKNAVSSLENGKFVEFLDAIRKSGNSSFKYLQNVYTTRDIQHQNISVALALSESLLRNYGVCRVHGGGFAGTIQAFVKNDFVGNYKEFINKIFGENSCHVLKVRKYGGIKVM